MEVIFEIEYRTEWGQRLVWCSGERRIAMEYRSERRMAMPHDARSR